MAITELVIAIISAVLTCRPLCCITQTPQLPQVRNFHIYQIVLSVVMDYGLVDFTFPLGLIKERNMLFGLILHEH